MYARYVPPPKGAATSPEPDHAAKPSNLPTLPQPTVYARYIPPPKSTKEPSQPPQHVHFDETDDIDEPPAKKAKLIENDENSKEPKQKSKKSKKSKKDAQLGANDSDAPNNDQPTTGPIIPNGINNDETPAELDTPDRPIAQESSPDKAPESVENAKKEKKEKKGKKKSKRKDEAEVEAEVDDGTPIRHRSVLKKAAKSIQRAPDPKPLADDQDVSMQDAAEVNGDVDINAKGEMDVDADVPEVQGLQPLPQPEPIAQDTTKPSYETLPPWLAKPIRVSPQAVAPFTQFGLSPELGISPEVAEKLAANGYKEAFAIQTAVIPLLLPHHDKSMHGDVLVSAATGSGKTLAYTLPVVRDLSLGNRHVTRLRAVVVLPTRELVRQVQQVCEQCSGVFSLNGSRRRVRVGIAMGSQPFDHEQEALVERGEKHDPEAYAKRNKRLASESGYGSGEDGDEGYNTEDEEKATIRKREDKIQTLPDHVVSYTSKVDILICTPGRLVEHIKYTPGFSLDFVRWLIVDEADKLLGQHFQQWLDVVIPRLQSNENGARNHKQSNLSGVRKIVLSATMTKDLDRLEGLKLRWPKLIVLEGSGAANEPEAIVTQADLALPELLEEAALKVSDSNLKPLFLLDLLQSEYIFWQSSPSRATQDSLDDDTSSSESDLDSESDLETSFRPSRTTGKGDKPSILIFTKSNETALRLSRLLSLLSPALASLVGTLTSTTQYATRRRTIRSFLAGKLRILVASDLVARGIDLPSLDHVVNYDVPSSVASYVHRVGRTARAGKTGRAWTLYTNPEARWFWNEVASENAIQRSKKVERVRVTEEKEDAFEKKVAAYESALAKLGEEASESRTKIRARSLES